MTEQLDWTEICWWPMIFHFISTYTVWVFKKALNHGCISLLTMSISISLGLVWGGGTVCQCLCVLKKSLLFKKCKSFHIVSLLKMLQIFSRLPGKQWTCSTGLPRFLEGFQEGFGASLTSSFLPSSFPTHLLQSYWFPFSFHTRPRSSSPVSLCIHCSTAWCFFLLFCP